MSPIEASDGSATGIRGDYSREIDSAADYHRQLNSQVAELIYKQLDAGQFRVVELSKGAFADPIRCKLSLTSFELPPVYKAVSYTWGHGTDSKPISLNSLDYYVTHNLEEALRYLRSETEEQLLWIDALCINQLDDNERSAQVQEMRKIFGFAIEVVAWLGTTAERSDDVIAMMLEATSWDLNGFQKFSKTGDDIALFHRVISLLKREWWARAWVVQEVAVADRVVLCCGSSRILYTDLQLFLNQGVTERGWGSQLMKTTSWGRNWGATASRIGPSEMPEPRSAKRGQYQRALQVLERFSTKRCTDRRDRVYAFIGLFHPQVRPAMTIDYSRSADEVNMFATRDLINGTNRLDVLTLAQCHVETQKSPIPVPSWLTDWGTPSRGIRPFCLVDEWGIGWGANRSKEFVNIENKTFKVRGVKVGSIHRAFSLPTRRRQYTFSDSDLITLLQYVDNCSHRLIPELSNDTARNGLLTILHCAINHGYWIHSIKILDRLLVQSRNSVEVETMQPETLAILESVKAVMTGRAFATVQVTQLVLRHRFVALVDHQIITLTNEQASEGDELFLLEGCSFPVVLRPNGDSFVLIGDAYVEAMRYFKMNNVIDYLNGDIRDIVLI